jgi:hypothetical protein
VDKDVLTRALAVALEVNAARVSVTDVTKADGNTVVYSLEILNEAASDAEGPELLSSYSAGVRLMSMAEAGTLGPALGVSVVSLNSAPPTYAMSAGAIAGWVIFALLLAGAAVGGYVKRDALRAAAANPRWPANPFVRRAAGAAATAPPRMAPPLPGRGAPRPALPAGWEEVTDPASKDVYYFNESSGQTTWDRPTAV